MRRLLSLALIGGLVWWVLGRRRTGVQPGATVGYADGSSVILDAGSPELDRLLQIAAGARAA